MSLRKALYAELIADADVLARVVHRIYFMVASPTHGDEYIVLHVVSDDHVSSMAGGSGLTTQRVQVDCWAKTASHADEIEALVHEAIGNFSGTLGTGANTVTVGNCYRNGARDVYVPPNDKSAYGTYCRQADYMITFNESIPVH
jgi:hypothetical protein